MGNAFNKTLYHLVGHVIGKEGRAISSLRPHNGAIGDGLTYWSPTINLQRDPRWGRNQEVPGEDPYLTSIYAREFVNGLQAISTSRTDSNIEQDNSLVQIQVGACCKHFVANSLERWGNVSRHDFDARIDEKDLHDYYFPPFKECVKQAVGVMCSYNSLNGKPACVNPWLLQDVLRKEWKYNGYLVTDCGALADVVNGHKYAINDMQAAALAKNATVDVNCGNGKYFPTALLQAYQGDLVEKATIEESFRRMAIVQFRLGLFDRTVKRSSSPLHDISVVGNSQHGQLAAEAALQSIVLLKNENLLPLHKDSKQRIAVIGPHIHATDALLSNYHGSKCDCLSVKHANKELSCIETPLQAITRKINHPENILSVKGCNIAGSELDEIEAAVQAAKASDLVVLILGLDNGQEREELDRNETTLPGLQSKLVQSILDVAAERTVLVFIHGGAMSIGRDAQSRAGAVLSCGYGGQAASDALARVLFGDYDPSGKLAATWYPANFVNELPMTEMGLRVGVGRTHMYFSGTPEFPFGHGLSYTKWLLEWTFQPRNIQDASVPLFLPKSQMLHISVRIENQGSPYYHGESSQTVLLFWRPVEQQRYLQTQGHHQLPRQKLIDFHGSKPLNVGQNDVLEFEVKWEDFALWSHSNSAPTVLHGMYELILQTAGTQLTKLVKVAPPAIHEENNEIKLA
jgi:beta-glucosidase-like glycosyl hydrolase